MTHAAQVVEALRARGWRVGTAESLTAGLVASGIADVPGCSDVLRGGVVAYAVDVKAAVLGIPDEVLDAGVVSREVAEAMAQAARRVLSADVGIATTGVAGPDPHAGEPVGSVWIAVAGPEAVLSRHLRFDGDRAEVRRATVSACWELVVAVCGEDLQVRPE